MGNLEHQKGYTRPKNRPLSQPETPRPPNRKLPGPPSMTPTGPAKRLTK